MVDCCRSFQTGPQQAQTGHECLLLVLASKSSANQGRESRCWLWRPRKCMFLLFFIVSKCYESGARFLCGRQSVGLMTVSLCRSVPWVCGSRCIAVPSLARRAKRPCHRAIRSLQYIFYAKSHNGYGLQRHQMTSSLTLPDLSKSRPRSWLVPSRNCPRKKSRSGTRRLKRTKPATRKKCRTTSLRANPLVARSPRKIPMHPSATCRPTSCFRLMSALVSRKRTPMQALATLLVSSLLVLRNFLIRSVRFGMTRLLPTKNATNVRWKNTGARQSCSFFLVAFWTRNDARRAILIFVDEVA